MAKESYLKFRCTDKMKSTVESKAKENNMSVTAYLEYLIRRDIDTMRTVMRDNLTKDIYTVALNTLAIERKVDYIRVHNVKMHRKLVDLMSMFMVRLSR